MLLASFPHPVFASDAASIQVTVPAPNPVVAGEIVTFQVLGVNTGTLNWAKGSYSWEVQIFDLENNYMARTDSVLPQEDVAPGGVSSAFIRFSVPETWLGRKFYKVYLVHNGERLIESEYQPFQISERPPRPPSSLSP